MAKKKKTKKSAPSSAQTFRVESRTQRNKKLAQLLVVSMIALISLYFGFLKSKMQIIQEIYIWGSFVLALGYVFCAFAIAFLKQKEEKDGVKQDQKLLQRLDKVRRGIIIVFLPMITSILIDIMLINLGLADNFGI